MKTIVPSRKQNILVILCMALLSFAGKTQTYTTQANGNWSSASTWVGGLVPSTTISAGKVVNVNHKVTFNYSNDLTIAGVVNITGDTLFFTSSYDKDVLVNAGGLLKVVNGGLVQSLSDNKSNLVSNGGKIVFDNAYVVIQKTFEAKTGSLRKIKNSKLIIGENYILEGSSSYPSIDTIQFSNIEVCTLKSGEFLIKTYGTLRVANAYINIKNSSKFKNESGATVIGLPGANGNFGFDYLKITDDFKNDGTWNARIDATCINGSITGSQMNQIDFTRNQDCSVYPLVGSAPELIFTNPVLVSGTANKQGAIYRFPNVIAGTDAQIKLKKFSRSDIVLTDIDMSSLGWDKAFQPQFGLAGNVQPNQHWYIDFELKFYEAGTNITKVLPKVDMTALDVDGDGLSIREYASFQNPSNVTYSTLNNLTEEASNNIGQLFTCPIDALTSLLIGCPLCSGDGKTGIWNLTDCSLCDATGILHAGCNHSFEGVNASAINGPVLNFVNIDTAATQVMAVYQFTDRSVINFRYGGKSGSAISNAGVRLNSLWFRQFSLSPVIHLTLPVKMESFTATLNNGGTKVDLKWTTASELNLSHFVVERSTDGINYSEAGTVFAFGNTTDKMDYSFPDMITNLQATIIYYRLRSEDKDGSAKYSETRIIRLNKQADNKITIMTYPNPVTNELRITNPASWQNKQVVYELFSANGTVVKRNATGSSSQTETMNVSNLSPGFYMLRATSNGEVAQQKIIKH